MTAYMPSSVIGGTAVGGVINVEEGCKEWGLCSVSKADGRRTTKLADFCGGGLVA